MLMIMIQEHVIKVMFFKYTLCWTETMRRNCGYVATKVENTSGNLSMVCIRLKMLKIVHLMFTYLLVCDLKFVS